MIKKITSMLLAVMMFAAMLPMTASAFSVSINGTPPYWGQNWWNLNPDEYMSVTRDDEVFYEGDHSLKFHSWGSQVPDHYLMIGTSISIKPGKDYVYGGWVKAEKASACYTMFEWSNTFDPLRYEGTFGWRRFENTYSNTSATKTSTSFSIVNSSNGGTIWFDSLYMYEIDDDGKRVGNNLFQNGHFDDNPDAKKDDKKQQASTTQAAGFDTNLESAYSSVVSSETFATSAMESVLGALPAYGIEEAKGEIKIDGNASDWKDYKTIKLPTKSDQYQVYNANASKDVTAKYKYAFDDKYFYFIAEVEDPVHVASTEANGYWQNDSIQMGISHSGEDFGYEMGLAYDPVKDISYKTCSGMQDDQVAKIQFKGSRNDIVTTYEMAFPWELKFENGRPAEFLCTFLINNNDGAGREYCVQVSRGISEGKFNTEFPRLIMSTGRDWYCWANASASEINVGKEITYSFTIVNNGTAKDFEFAAGDEKKTINVPANSGKNFTHSITAPETYGSYKANFSISCGEESEAYTFSYDAMPTKSYFDNAFVKYDTWLAEISSLIESCKAANIVTDYENMAYEILKEFYDYTKQDINGGELAKAAYNVDAMEDIYEETVASLKAYLDGTKTAPVVPRYQTGTAVVKNKQFYADMKVGDRIENRPSFFIGYGHWTGEADTRRSHLLGTNATQWVVSPAGFLQETSEGYGFSVNKTAVENFRKKLEYATESNIMVAVNLEHHDFPAFLLNKYTDLRISENAGGFFVRYNIDHPVAKSAIETYVRAVAEVCKDYPCVDSFIVGNEDMYRTAYIPYYRPYFQLYLTEKYGADINRLNALYGTNYTTFREIEMPTSNFETPLFYDYRDFNNGVFQDWHAWVADIVKEYRPDAEFHVKWVDDIREDDAGDARIRPFFMGNGMDPERFDEWATINGNDGGFFFDYQVDSFEPLDYLYAADIQTASLTAPVFNSEVHYLFDGCHDYGDKYQRLVGAHTWQSAVHSVAGQVHWFLGLRDWNYDLFSDRPDCMYQLGKTAMDTNRFAYELEALNNKRGDVKVLYSQTSRVHQPSYLNSSYEAYKAVAYAGKKPDVAVESHIDDIMNYKILVLPNTQYVKPETVTQIKAFVDAGGKLIMIGEDCLKYDGYRKPHDAALVAAIKAKAAVVVPVETLGARQQKPTVREMEQIIDKACNDLGMYTIDLIDTATGEKVDEMEYMHVEYNGKILVNLCDWYITDKTNVDRVTKVKIRVNGKDYTGNIKELRSGESLSSEFTVEAFKPLLLEISK